MNCVSVVHILKILPVVRDAEVEGSEVYFVVIRCALYGLVSCLLLSTHSYFKPDINKTPPSK
jgi:hypothetical protein